MEVTFTLNQYKEVSKQIRAFEKKTKVKFNVTMVGATIENPKEDLFFEPAQMVFRTYNELCTVYEHVLKSLPFGAHYTLNKLSIHNLVHKPCMATLASVGDFPGLSTNSGALNRSDFPSFRFFPKTALLALKQGLVQSRSLYNNVMDLGVNAYLIYDAPVEVVEKDITYRILYGAKDLENAVVHCAAHTHKSYNYLDKGSFFFRISRNIENETNYIITNELTFDTWLVIVACLFHPKAAAQLTDGCYLNSNTAKLARIKVEKLLPKPVREVYDRFKKNSQSEFEKVQSDNILGKLLKNEVKTAVFNEVKLEPTRARYETISVEAPDFLDTVKKTMAFDDRLDIYGLIRTYADSVFKRLQAHVFNVLHDTNEKPPDPFFELKINNIPIRISRTIDNTRRYVNGHPINIIEVEQVVFRASCFNDANLYNAFLKEVSRMSLLWHDVIANGLRVKIGMLDKTSLSKESAPPEAPRLRFKKMGKDIHLILEEGRTVKIKFSKLLQKVKTLNRIINGRNYYEGYNMRQRNGIWGAEKLRTILKECATFTEVVKNADGTATTTKVELLNDDQTLFVTKLAEEAQRQAIEKSKKFLETAVKTTGAVEENFLGQPMMIVQGKLRKYAVCKADNRVYNYDAKKSICIVEPGHTVGVGFDALAARLYALKSDSVLLDKIGTLKHG